jgi:hypothetical protein
MTRATARTSVLTECGLNNWLNIDYWFGVGKIVLIQLAVPEK